MLGRTYRERETTKAKMRKSIKKIQNKKFLEYTSGESNEVGLGVEGFKGVESFLGSSLFISNGLAANLAEVSVVK